MKKNNKENPHVRKLILLLGGMKNVADAGGVCTAMVWKWLHCKSPITPESVIPLETKVSREVTRTQMRPDIFLKE